MRSCPPLTLALTALLFSACGDNLTGDLSEARTIGDFVRIDPRFSTLESALGEADLLSGLDQAGPFTLMAPTDAAFDDLIGVLGISSSELLALSELGELLNYHVHNGELSRTALERRTAITTAAGAELHVRFGVDGIKLNDDVTITSESIDAENGIIHVLDAALRRPLATTTVVKSSSPDIPIADRTEEGIGRTSDFLTVTETGFLHSLEVTLDIQHSRAFDIIVLLEHSQSGTFVSLVNRPFSVLSNVVTDLRDSADFDVIDDAKLDDPSGTAFPEAAYRPIEPFEFLLGTSISGEWTIRVLDLSEGEVGRLRGWSLKMTYGADAPGEALVFGRSTGGSGVLPRGFKEPIDLHIQRLGGLAGDVTVSGTAGSLTASSDLAQNFGTLTFDVARDAALGAVDARVTAQSGDVSRIRAFDARVVEPDRSGMELVAHVSLEELGAQGFEGNDIWGWTDPVSGKEYALMGTEVGTTFVDLSTPETPVIVGMLATHTDSALWRDIKVFNDHAFIVSEASGHGLQVFDLTELRGVTAPQTFTATAHFAEFGNAHNIAINEDSGFAYVVGATQDDPDNPTLCFGGLLMIDISTPTAPTRAGCFGGAIPAGEAPGELFPQDAYIHDVQCVNYAGPDPDYAGREICISSDGQVANANNYLAIADVTDKNAPIQVSRKTYQGAGYAHQGWLTEDHSYFILNDEFDEFIEDSNTRTYVWDVRDLDNPVVIGNIVNPRDAVGHNTYIKGNLAYQANYTSGLRIVDISDIANGNGTEVGYFDSFPNDDDNDEGNAGARCSRPARLGGPLPHPDQEPTDFSGCGQQSFDGAWSNYPFFDSGLIVISDMQRGMFVVRPTSN